jgi:uncharacterized protein YutE (UPF0331/DUF86 family)
MRTGPEFVRRKLGLIAEDLDHLTGFRDETVESLSADPVKLAAVERMLERIITRAIDVNEHLIAALSAGDEDRVTRLTYRDTFLRLAALGVYPADFAESIAASAGLRNILVHQYNDVDHRLLHGSIRSCLQDYRRYVEHVAAFVARFDDEGPEREP